ncbi:MAG: DUF805 domain-containing protein [Cucumibacter sp.]
MNDYLKMFMGFDGRLNRQRFWLGVIGLIVASIVVSMILGSIFGVQMFNFAMVALQPDADPAAMALMATNMMKTSGWVSLVALIILAYPGMALWMKRAHDRDSNGQLVYVFYGLLALSYVLQGLGLTVGTMDIGGVSYPSINTIGWILSVASGLLGLYLLITLGFLKGTSGPNTYGPDPLGAKAAA